MCSLCNYILPLSWFDGLSLPCCHVFPCINTRYDVTKYLSKVWWTFHTLFVLPKLCIFKVWCWYEVIVIIFSYTFMVKAQSPGRRRQYSNMNHPVKPLWPKVKKNTTSIIRYKNVNPESREKIELFTSVV